MSDDWRSAVLDGARYLRGVRPLDPEELCDYVEGGVHPAVARQALRESAHELGIVERPDGTFVPVGDEPVAPGLGTVRRLPRRYDDALRELLVERYGPDWATGEGGERLRSTVRRLKEEYHRDRAVEYDDDVAAGYAVYHLADFYAAVQYVLEELAAAGLLGRRLRVLDVGAGVGGPALGVHDYLFGPPAPDASADGMPDGRPGRDRASDPSGAPGDGDPTADRESDGDDGDPPATDRRRDPTAAVVDYHAVEPSAAADVLERLLATTGENFGTTVHRATAEAFDPDGPLEASPAHSNGSPDDPDLSVAPAASTASTASGEQGDPSGGGAGDRSGTAGDGPSGDRGGYDLVLFANVLNELADPVATARRYCRRVAPTGALVALAPADRRTSTGLRSVERSLEAAGATVFSPTVRLWPGRTPGDEMWSFDERPALSVPSVQRELDEAAGATGEFRKTAVRFSYSVLRRDDRRRLPTGPDPERWAPMADAGRYVTERVDLVGVKLSRDLSDGDANPLFRVGDGSQRVAHFAVLVEETALNRTLRTADYGAALAMQGVLALYNDDEGAYNLVVDGESVVDRL